MKVAAYCRVSTNSEDQENSFENQKQYFESKIIEDGDDLVAVYADQGISGTKLNRPEFNRMLLDAGLKLVVYDERTRTGVVHTEEWQADPNKEPKFEEIWIKNTSRFARNVLATKVLSELKAKKVYVRFVEQGLSTREESLIFTIEMMSLVDSQESRGKSSKVKWGQERSLEKGRLFTQSKLYGYTYIKEENRLVVRPDESKIVKEIFELYSQGYGHRRIANILKKQGVKTRSGIDFGKSTIMRIIDNEKYAGFNNGGKYDTGQVYVDKHYGKVRENYRLVKTDKIEPIVSEELFNKCKTVRNGKVSVYNQRGVNKGFSKYSGKIFCAKCGAPYISNVDEGRKFYNCRTKKKYGTEVCKNLNVKEERLDNMTLWIYENYSNLIEYFIEYSGVVFQANKDLNEVALQLYNYKESDDLNTQYENANRRFERIKERYLEADEFEHELLKGDYEAALKCLKDLSAQIKGEKTEKQMLEERFCSLYYTITTAYNDMKKKPTTVEEMLKNSIEKIYVDDSFIYCSFKKLDSDVNKAIWEKILYPHDMFDGKKAVHVSYIDENGKVKPLHKGEGENGYYMMSYKDEKDGSFLIEEVFRNIPNEIKERMLENVKNSY